MKQENFIISLGVIQSALTELLNSEEHRFHPARCHVVNCAVEDARALLKRYSDDCLFFEHEVSHALHLVRLHEGLANLAMFTADAALRNRARAVWFSTSISARRAAMSAADLLNEAVKTAMKPLTIRRYPGIFEAKPDWLDAVRRARPMAVRKKP